MSFLKKYIFLILFFCLTGQIAFSQSYKVKLNWRQNYEKGDTSSIFKVLYFDNSASFDASLIPYFSKNINISKIYETGFDYTIKLENTKFIALSKDEKTLIKNTEKIKTDIHINTELNFARGIPYLKINFLPFRKDKSGLIYKLSEFDYKIIRNYSKSEKINKAKLNSTVSVLSSGTWKKIKIKTSGVYKITFDQLRALGFDNPENIRIFGNAFGWLPMIAGEPRPDDLIENDILIKDNAVYFYGQGPDRWDYDEVSGIFFPVRHFYSEYAYYFLTDDYNSGYSNSVKTETSTSLPETKVITKYIAYSVHEQDRLHIEKTGRRMFGEAFDINNNQTFEFNFPGYTGTEAYIYVRAASTSSASYFTVKAGNVTENLNFGYIGDYDLADAKTKDFRFTAPAGNSIAVNLNFHPVSPADRAWLDYIFINAECNLKFNGGQMFFVNPGSYGTGNVSKYVISNASSDITVWDISDKTKPKKINTVTEGSALTFKLTGETLRKFIIFDNTSFLVPDIENAEDVPNQNLHATSGKTDMIIVTNPDFLVQANKLKNIHEQKDGMRVKVVTSEQVYNEFSSGMPDFSAIRDYAKMVYDRAYGGDTLRYLCLFGDGSYDNRSGEGINGNFMITYQQSNSVSIGKSLVTDDFFGFLDDGEGDTGTSLNGLLDIGVGRIIVSTPEQAENHISKIENYINSSTLGDWRNNVTFIADDENNNIHMIQADGYAEYVKKNYPFLNIEKIYLDSYTQYTTSGGERYPDVNTAINNRMQKGALLVNYTGHGGELGLAHERVVTVSEIDSWRNFDKLPLFVTATCEFTRFDDYNFLSAGEHVFLNPQGGAIALFSTARIAWIYSNGVLSSYFFKNVFENTENGKHVRLGDIIRKTKTDYSSNDILIFFLFGDPALKLGFAHENNVVTTSINGHPITQTDTLKALSEASFTGIVTDKNGNKLTNFNGYVYPTVFDKEVSVNTLNNDDNGVFTYKDRNNIVYRGKASVTGGDFSFAFIVPKDIILSVDTGKISYYAENGITDAKGYGFDFMLGDISSEYEEDNIGPEINLYMNDENFVSGGITDTDPRIFAKLYDEHGINTATGGIGHDITGILDEDNRNIIIMNDDYRADENTYKSGTVEHFLFDLEPGEHNLKFKAWDVYNNSSEAEIDFVVAETGNLTIDRLLNYPNPFTTHTEFWFEHNQPGQNLDVIIQIFTVSGKLVKTIEDSFTPDGYRAGPYEWDGTDDFGNRIGRGVYVYKVKVRNETGETADKFEKLLILK